MCICMPLCTIAVYAADALKKIVAFFVSFFKDWLDAAHTFLFWSTNSSIHTNTHVHHMKSYSNSMKTKKCEVVLTS